MFRQTTIIMPLALMAFAIVAYLTLIDYSISMHLRSGESPTVYHACTDEAKLCPDGSAVGRTGPDCIFSLCSGESEISNFAECEAAGYPVGESYPRQCFANSQTFVEPLANTNSATTNGNVNAPITNVNPGEVACATDVQTCSDGSYVQRVPPSCEFANCPPGTEPISPVLSQ